MTYTPFSNESKKDMQWWLKEEPHESMVATAEYVESKDSFRKAQNRLNMRLYGNAEFLNYGGSENSISMPDDRVTLNVIKAATDAVVSKIVKNKPKATFLTSGGNYTLKRKARTLEQFIDTRYYESGLYGEAPRMVQDSCVFGTGIIKTYINDETIAHERTFPGELFVDQAEGLYGTPRQMFQRKFICREVLLGMFPDKEKEISSASEADYQDVGRDSAADQIKVWEAWHLPSRKGAKDGRHVIAIAECTLVEEPWKVDWFPFTFLRWTERLRGFWGAGLAEELQGIQVEVNRILQKIQKCFHLLAVPRVFLDHASKIQSAHINNQIGAIVKYTGQPPVIAPPQTVHPEMFSHLDRLYTRSFEIAGISQLSASGTKPSGLDSAVAIREFHDIETERFADFGQHYEEAFCDITRKTVYFSKQIAKSNKNYGGVSQRDKYSIETVLWSQIDLEEDSYVLKVFPTSSLPGTPAGKLAMVERLIGGGFIDQDAAKRLLDFPDLQSDLALDRAASDDLDRIIEKMIDEGEWESPEPFQDHMLAIKRFQSAYLKAKADGVPEDRLQLMRDFMTSTQELINQAQQAQQTMAMAQGAAPMDGSGAPPQAPTGNEGIQ